MLKVKAPKHLFLEGGDEAVLLLHSFTGTVQDVKEVAEALHKAGYTCYAPCYRGHGLPVSEFVQYDIRDWWEDAEAAYGYLHTKGYHQITVLGVSLGGIFALKLAEQFEVKQVIGMSVPYHKSAAGVLSRLNHYGTRLQYYIGCTEEEQAAEMAYVPAYQEGAAHFEAFVNQTMSELDQVNVPTLLLYGGKDDVSYQESVEHIAQKLVHASLVETECFEESGHLMTRSAEKQKVIEKIINFM
ncbi:alpha/beta hydrolase [Staphylococcus simulans]